MHWPANRQEFCLYRTLSWNSQNALHPLTSPHPQWHNSPRRQISAFWHNHWHVCLLLFFVQKIHQKGWSWEQSFNTMRTSLYLYITKTIDRPLLFLTLPSNYAVRALRSCWQKMCNVKMNSVPHFNWIYVLRITGSAYISKNRHAHLGKAYSSADWRFHRLLTGIWDWD